MLKFSRSKMYCVCGGLICVLLPAAVVGFFAPLMCKKHKDKVSKNSTDRKEPSLAHTSSSKSGTVKSSKKAVKKKK